MAVTENMLIDLQVSTGDAEKNVKSLTQDMSKLTVKSAETNESIKLLSAQFSKLGKMFVEVGIELTKTSRLMTGNLNDFDKQIKVTDKDLKRFNSSISLSSNEIKEYSKQESYFTRLATAIRLADANLMAFVNTIRVFINLFKIITDPKNIKFLADITNVLAALALSKGMTGTADKLRMIGDRLDLLSEKSQDFKDNSGKNFDEIVQKTRALNNAVDAIGPALLSIGGTCVLAGAGRAALQLENVQKKVLPLNASMLKTGETMKTVFGNMTKDVGGPLKGTIGALETYSAKQNAILGKGFLNLGKSFASTVATFHAVDLLAIFSPALIAIGGKLKESENEWVSWAGTIIKTVGWISAGFMAIAGIIIFAIGNIALAIGEKLVKSMEEASAKFIKFDAIMAQFMYTVKGFIRVFGVESIGSMEYWNQTMEKLYKTTVFTREEIAKSVKLLIAEGQVIGLTVDENSKLLSRASDVAAATGRDLYEVTQMIVSGLTNNADAVLALGIDIRNTSLAHSKYVEEAGIAVEQMNSQELAMARLATLYERTIPLIGSANNQTKTIAGSNLIYEKTINDITIAIGESGTATQWYLSTINKLLETIKNLPKPVLKLYGDLKDLAGVILIVTGNLIKLLAILFTIITAMKMVNWGLAKWLGLSISISQSLIFIVARVLPFIAAMLMLKAAFDDLWESSQGFRDTIKTMADNLAIFKSNTDEAEKSTAALASTMSNFGSGVLAVFKMSMIGLAQAVNTVAISFIRWKQLLNRDKKEKEIYELQVHELYLRIADLTKATNQAHRELGIYGAGTALAAENAKKLAEETEKNTSLVQKFRERVIKLAKEINQGFDPAIERQRVLGNEFVKAISTYKQSEDELKNIFKLKSGERDLAQKYAEAEKKKLTSALEIEKLRLDTMKKISDQQRALQADILRTQGRNIQAIKLERDEAIKALDEQIAGMKLLGDVREEDLQKLEQTRKLLLKSSDIKILEERNKFNQKALDAEKLLSDIRKDSAKAEGNVVEELKARVQARTDEIAKMEQALKATHDHGTAAKKALMDAKQVLKDMFPTGLAALQLQQLDEIAKKNLEIEDQINQMTMTQYDLTEAQYQKELDLLAIKEAQLDKDGLLNEALQDQINATAELLKKQRDIARSKQPSAQYQQMEQAGKGIAENISGVFTKGALGMVGGAMSFVGAIVDAIGALIDFIPQFIDKIAGIFDKLTNFGSTLLNAFKNLGRSMVDFVKNFIPNIMKAIPDIVETIVDFLAEGLPNALQSLIDQLPSVIDKFMERIPEIVEKFVISTIDNIPRITYMLIQAIIKLLPKIVRIFAYEFVWAVVKGIVNGIANGLKNLPNIFKGMSIKGPDTKKMVNDLSLSMKAATKTLTGESSKIFAVMDLNAAATTTDIIQDIKDNIFEGAKKGVDYLTMWWHKLLKFLQDVWDGIVGIWRGLWSFVKVLWDGIVNTLRGLWEALQAIWTLAIDALTKLWENLRIAWDGIISALQATWDGIISALTMLWDSVKMAWDNIISALQNTWNTINSALFAIWDGVKGMWDGVIGTLKTLFDGLKGMWDGVIAALKTIIEILKSVWSGITKSFSDFWTSLKDVGKKVWDGIVESIKKGGDVFLELGTKIWEGLKNGLSGIGKLLGDQLAKIDPSNLFKRMFNIEGAKGQGTVEKALSKMGSEVDVPFISFAKGGMVPGAAKIAGDSMLNDKILAFLSPGEAVIPRSLMGNTAVKAIVDAVLSGKLNPEGYGGGSVKVGGTKIGISDKGVTVGDTVILPSPTEVLQDVLSPMTGLWDQVKKQAFDMIMKMFEANKFHTGGMVPAFANGGDVPAILNPGEFVINKRSAQGLGYDYLNKLNTGKMEVNPNITINIEIETTQPIDETFFRNNLMPRIKEDIKRRTLNGEFIVSTKGVR
jgi:phage-related protein